MVPSRGFEPDTQRLAHRETAVDQETAIVDAHHLWDTPAHASATFYSLPELRADLAGGHRVRATVFVECGSHYLEAGPAEARAAGETAWIAGQPRRGGEMAAVIGFADVRLGRGIKPVLDAHIAAAGSATRFAGIRFITSWDESPEAPRNSHGALPGTLVRPETKAAVRELGQRGLVFETMCYFRQLDELGELARSAPDTLIVVNHLGGPLGVGPYARDREAVRARWRPAVARLAAEENVVMKIGGLGCSPYMTENAAARLNSSTEIAEYWEPEVGFCIETFGPGRCLAESNFPVDSRLCDYVTLWNALKKMTRGLSSAEREAVFAETADRVYGLSGTAGN